MIKRPFVFPILLLAALTLGGCDEKPLATGTDLGSYIINDQMLVTIAADESVFPCEGEFILQITATNMTQETIVFGRGSSSCQLGALILIDGEPCPAMDARMCTADVGPWELEAEATLQEDFLWEGAATIGGELKMVSPGSYQVRGLAGTYTGEPIQIEVVE